MFFTLMRLVLFEKRLHGNQSTTSFVHHFDARAFHLVPYSVEICYKIRHFLLTSATPGYDCRSVLKHVLKSYDIFFGVNNRRKRVVGLIYTKQFMS